jgi:hypothetical protein
MTTYKLYTGWPICHITTVNEKNVVLLYNLAIPAKKFLCPPVRQSLARFNRSLTITDLVLPSSFS